MLFLSQAFLHRMRLTWNTHHAGYLVGYRNFHFYCPDSIVPSDVISSGSVDSFLQQQNMGVWDLLGFISYEELPLLPGYVFVHTGGDSDPRHWTARLAVIGEKDIVARPLEIVVSQQP